MLYEYYCKPTMSLESEILKEIPQEEITWISIELVRADGRFSLNFQISLNCFQSYLQAIQRNDKTSAMS